MIINNAKVNHRHSNKLEARRENQRSQNFQKRMYKQAKDLQKKQQLEDAKEQAANMAVGKVMNSGTEFE